MNREILRDLINQSNARMMVVTFVKTDGTLRKMYCKKGIKRFKKKCNVRKYTNRCEDTIRVYDCEVKGYRAFKLDSVVRLTCGNKIWSDKNAWSY